MRIEKYFTAFIFVNADLAYQLVCKKIMFNSVHASISQDIHGYFSSRPNKTHCIHSLTSSFHSDESDNQWLNEMMVVERYQADTQIYGHDICNGRAATE